MIGGPARPASEAVESSSGSLQRAATVVPAYRHLLREHGIEPEAIVDRETFAACAHLTKATRSTCFRSTSGAEGTLAELAELLTSSGTGKIFLRLRAPAAACR